LPAQYKAVEYAVGTAVAPEDVTLRINRGGSAEDCAGNINRAESAAAQQKTMVDVVWRRVPYACPARNGPDNFDFDSREIVERWHETGQVSDQLIATRYRNNMEIGKKLACPYPQVAKYKGTGSVDDPVNFFCSKP
jgi:Tannase and feruloyl esterase